MTRFSEAIEADYRRVNAANRDEIYLDELFGH